MAPLFMDTDSQSTSEDTSVRGEEEPQGPKKKIGGRRERNRDAARNSRKRQTERADKLHEELQNLEHSNSALEKEIAALWQEFHHYEMVLECHKPHCCLQVSNSSWPVAAPTTAALQCLSGPSNVPLQKSFSKTKTYIPHIPDIKLISFTDASNPFPAEVTPTVAQPTSQCIYAACLSNPTLASSPGICTLNSSESTHIPLSSPVPKSNTSKSSTCLFPSTNPPLYSYSSTALNPKTLFVKTHSPLTSDRASNASLNKIHTSASNLLHLSSTTVVPCFGQEMSPLSSSGSTDDVLQTNAAILPHTALAMSVIPHSGFGNTFLAKQVTIPNGSLLKDDAPLVPSDPSSEHGTTTRPGIAIKASSQMLKVSYQNTTNPTPLLSLLSVPSPLPDFRMTSNDFDGFSGVTPIRDIPKGPSFSELLECNDWLLDNVSVMGDL